MKYFTIKELTKSSTAEAKGIDNTPTPEVERNLTALVDNILDGVREIYGKPITVNSGYRCPELNKAVGGSATSDHVKGFAADITAGSKEENERLFNIIKHNFHFSQLIDEKNFSWVHVSYNPNNLKNQTLKL
nr:MAG TPA: peptidase [Caudoviricetes sp.]